MSTETDVIDTINTLGHIIAGDVGRLRDEIKCSRSPDKIASLTSKLEARQRALTKAQSTLTKLTQAKKGQP